MRFWMEFLVPVAVVMMTLALGVVMSVANLPR